MLTALFPEMMRGVCVSLALVAGAFGAPKSDAGAAAPRTAGQDQPAAAATDPRAGTSDDTLASPPGGIVKVTVDGTRLSKHGPRDVKVLARHGTLIALSDTYSPKPRGAGLCEAGQETWFRIIDTSARAERYARIVNSCVGSEQWGDPPVTVTQDGARITLNLLSEPAVTLTLSVDGEVTANQ
jgi:hypothetical protein